MDEAVCDRTSECEILFESSSDPICIVGTDGYFKRVNGAFRDVLGWSEEELMGRPLSDFIHPDDLAATLEAFTGAVAGAPVSGFENRCLCADGGMRWLQWKGGTIEPGRLYAIARDISEQRRSAHELTLRIAEFRTLADLATSGIFRTGTDRRCHYVNASWCEQAGISDKQALDLGWLDAIHPDDRERVTSAWRMAAATSSRFEMRFRFLHHTGEVRHVFAAAAPVYSDDQVVGYIGTTIDETDTRHREQELADANREMRARIQEAEARNRELVLLHEMSDLLQSGVDDTDVCSVLDEFMPVLFPGSTGAVYLLSASRALAEASASWGATPLPRSFAPSDCWALRRSALHCPRSEGLRCAHAGPVDMPHVCLPMMAQGETVGVVVICHADRAELVDSMVLAKSAADQVALALANLRLRVSLRSQSIRDPLTGLFNRRYMEETFERELARARREQVPVSVLMLDLDHFKKYNDTHGHAGADQLLREFGGLLAASFRREDIICRVGGEEFVVILPGASADEAEVRAECVRAATRALTVRFQGQALGTATVSIGVAEAFLHGESPEALLRAADEALYRAKSVGRDRVIVAGAWRRTETLEALA